MGQKALWARWSWEPEALEVHRAEEPESPEDLKAWKTCGQKAPGSKESYGPERPKGQKVLWGPGPKGQKVLRAQRS